MLSFHLGTHHVHALAFSPDGDRLAAACGRDLTEVDWRNPGEPVWHAPLLRTPGRATSLAYRPDGRSLLASYSGHRVYSIDPAAGGFSESVPVYGSAGVIWETRSAVVIAGADLRAVLMVGYPSATRVDGPSHAFVLLPGPAAPAARLAGPPVFDPAYRTRTQNRPCAAWIDGRGRMTVWSAGLLRHFRWPPPPVEPLRRWQMLASALTRSFPQPPALELLAEYPLPQPDAQGLAPLPDGETVLLVSRGAVIRWHAPSGKELSRMRWPKVQFLRSVAVSPDGTVAAVGGNNGRVIVWDLDP